MTRIDVPNVPNAFVLTNVLSSSECRQVVAAAEGVWREEGERRERRMEDQEYLLFFFFSFSFQRSDSQETPHSPVNRYQSLPITFSGKSFSSSLLSLALYHFFNLCLQVG